MGNYHGVKFHEIENDIFQEIERMIMRSKVSCDQKFYNFWHLFQEIKSWKSPIWTFDLSQDIESLNNALSFGFSTFW